MIKRITANKCVAIIILACLFVVIPTQGIYAADGDSPGRAVTIKFNESSYGILTNQTATYYYKFKTSDKANVKYIVRGIKVGNFVSASLLNFGLLDSNYNEVRTDDDWSAKYPDNATPAMTLTYSGLAKSSTYYIKVNGYTPYDDSKIQYEVGVTENVENKSSGYSKANKLKAARNINKITVTASDIKKASDLGATTITLGAKVKKINKNAFKGTNIKTIVVRTKKLKAAKVKKSLKGSKVTTVKVDLGKKKLNKKYIKKYKKIFTKKNAGKKVSVK